MQVDDVIILSSPDMSLAVTGPSRRRKSRQRPPKASTSALEPIELDSDDDNDQYCNNNTPPKSDAKNMHPNAPPKKRHNQAREPQKNIKGKGKMPQFWPDDSEDGLQCRDHEEPRPAQSLNRLEDFQQSTATIGSQYAAEYRATSPPADPLDTCLARVLEVVPDVEPQHAMTLLRALYPTNQEHAVALVLHSLFENSYPKVNKAKRKRAESDDEGAALQKVKVDYASKERPFTGGEQYQALAMEQLLRDFPRTPVAYLRKSLDNHNKLYAPTYLHLAREARKVNLPVRQGGRLYRSKGKDLHDNEFENERSWLLLKLQDDNAEKDKAVAEKINEREYEETGDGIECGCCFSSYPFDMMVQCPEAHLFCRECMTSYAKTQLGEHNPNIVCMDQLGCKAPFTDSELRRFLSPKLIELYDRVKQLKDIEAAQIEGLEECPFCEYKVVIENEQEKLFRCERRECGAVSCRQCKKLDHLPKSCKEADDEKHLDGQHEIEEAMTKALMRNCPQCQKAFIKDQGCNKMICPNCRTASCYICRQPINGYEHFAQNVPHMGQQMPPSNSNKCVLWDSVDERHANEVNEAARKALGEYKKQNPDATDEDLRIQLAKAPVAPANANPALPILHANPVGFGVPGPAYPPHIRPNQMGFGFPGPAAPLLHPPPVFFPPPPVLMPPYNMHGFHAGLERQREELRAEMRRFAAEQARTRAMEYEAQRRATFEAQTGLHNRIQKPAARRQARR